MTLTMSEETKAAIRERIASKTIMELKVHRKGIQGKIDQLTRRMQIIDTMSREGREAYQLARECLGHLQGYLAAIDWALGHDSYNYLHQIFIEAGICD